MQTSLALVGGSLAPRCHRFPIVFPQWVFRVDRATHDTQESAVLTAVAAVVARKQKKAAGLLHVVQPICDLTDEACDSWTIEDDVGKAEGRSIREKNPALLLDRLLATEWTGLDGNIRLHRFLYNVAIAKHKMQIVDWWLTKYLPLTEATAEKIMKRVVDYNRIHVLKLLEQKGLLTPTLENRIVKCRQAEVAYWLYEREFRFRLQ